MRAARTLQTPNRHLRVFMHLALVETLLNELKTGIAAVTKHGLMKSTETAGVSLHTQLP